MENKKTAMNRNQSRVGAFPSYVSGQAVREQKQVTNSELLKAKGLLQGSLAWLKGLGKG